MQDLNDMLLFAEVVERGGFAAAGRALGLPKSRLSRRVAGLEAQLGVRLLQRTTRKLSLTEVGEAYLRHCQALRESAQAAADTVAQVQTEPCGTLRVACPVTLAQTVLAELMPDFLARYPLVRVDMALRVRTSLDDSGSLVIKRLGDDEPLLVASPALLARQGTPTTLDELSRLDSMAMSTTDGRASIPLTGPDGRQTILQHTPRYVADDLLTLHVAALAGTGMCWLPSYMCEDDLRQGRLVRLLPDWQTPRGLVPAVFPPRRGLTPAVRCFLDFLGEHVPTHSSLLGSEAPGQVP